MPGIAASRAPTERMARPSVPDALVMRELKYGTATTAEKDRVAALLRAAGRRTEALLLYEGRADHPALRLERDHAITHGMVFPLQTLQRLGTEVTPEHFKACAAAAEQNGRWLDARICYLLLKDEAAVRRIAAHLPASLVPPPPPEPPAAGAPVGATS
jgi:hypothetical protein